MKTYINTIILFFIFNGSYTVLASNDKITKQPEKLILAEQLIEDGSINLAYLILKEYSETKISKNLKYRVYKDLAKIHLFEQDMVNYEKLNKKAYQLKKEDGEIYKGMYYAEKAFFWHYLMWGDSAAFYSNRSMEIIQRNRTDFSKINVSFVYQMYAIGFLYRKLEPTPKVKIIYEMPVARILMNQWFDSAKVYEKKFPFQFSSERVYLYRGVGTRYLDHVSGYQYQTKEYQKSMNISQWYSYKKAMEAYNYTIQNVINPRNWNDIILTKSLKGLCYMCIGEKIKAKHLFNSVLVQYLKRYKNHSNSPNARALMTLYSYKTINDETLPFNDTQTKKDIQILKNLNNNWWASFNQAKEYNYDPYSESPNNYLFKLYLRRYFIKHQKEDLKEATTYLLSQFLNFHFIKQEERTNGNRFNNADLEFRNISDLPLKSKIQRLTKLTTSKLKSAPKVSIDEIQNNLKTNECLILPCHRKSGKDTYKIIIEKNTISIVKAKNDVTYTMTNYDTLSFKAYKKIAFEEYNLKIKPVLSFKKHLKKIYTMYFDYSNYSNMISDSTGNNYDQLKYLAKKIQFVSIYNPYSFFTSPKMASQKELKFVKLKNEEYSKLPFMDILCQKKFNPLNCSQTVFQGNLPKYLNSKGIIHLYGHGNFKINSELGSINLELPYQTNNQVLSISKIQENQEVNNSLIVLNNCFSGFNVNISSREFDRGIYLSLLNKGALNVIVSPNKTDDEASSKIFKSFYQNIAKGESTEDALYHAQLYYLKTNQGSLAHPKFWSPYRLISNYRFPIYTTNNKENRNAYFIFSAISFVVISGIILLYVRKRNS